MNLVNKKERLNFFYHIINRNGDSIPFRLNGVQEDVLDNMHTRNLILKARQLGMSTFAVLYLLDEVIFKKNLSAGIVSYSLEHAQHIFKKIIGHALDAFPKQYKDAIGIVQRSAREITFSNGSSIRVDTTLRGGSYPLVLVSEFGKTCARNPQKAEEVITGTLQAVPKNGTVIIESTGEGSSGFFAEMILESERRGNDNLTELDYKLFFYNWLNEPSYQLYEKVVYDVNLTDYFDKLEKQLSIKITQPQRNWYAIQQRLLGDKLKQEFPSTVSESFLSSSDAFYFSEAISRAYTSNRCLNTSLYDALMPVYVAMDIGLNDLTVMIFFQIAHGEIRVIDYYEDKNKDVPFYAKFLLQDKHYHYHTIFLPHDSVKRYNSDIQLTYERDFKRLFSGTNTQFHVLKAMDKQLSISHTKLMIDRCVFNVNRVKQLLDQMAKYRKKWSEQLGRYLEEPLHDTACFIGETIIETECGKKRIDKIKVGDKVKTPNGFKKVINKFQYKTKNIIKIYLYSSSIICTPHHKVFTMKGLVNADSLCHNDIIITDKDEKLCKKISYLGLMKNTGFKETFLSISIKQLYILMDTSIEKIISDTGLEEVVDQKKDMDPYIDRSGHIIMEKFQKTCIYIIKTVINQIMKLKTLNLLILKITQNFIALMKKKKCHDFILINVEKKQINGTLQKKVLNGIKKMEEKLLNVKNQSIKYVNSVIKNFLPFGIKLYFAPLLAEQKTGFYREKTMNTEPVNFVKKNLHAINMQKKGLVQKVVQLNPQLLQEVYDIEIEDDHCYYANGFLVSNSNYADSFRYLSQAVSHIETVSGTKGALEKHKIAVESRYRRVF